MPSSRSRASRSGARRARRKAEGKLRKALVLLLGLGGVAFAYLRFRRPGRKDRVDVYFEDGSSVAFEPDTPEGARLIALAGDVRAAAR